MMNQDHLHYSARSHESDEQERQQEGTGNTPPQVETGAPEPEHISASEEEKPRLKAGLSAPVASREINTEPGFDLHRFRTEGVARSAVFATPSSSAALLARMAAKDPGQSSADTLPLRLFWPASPVPQRQGRDTTLLIALLAILITLSGVLLSAATYSPTTIRTPSSTTSSGWPTPASSPVISDPLTSASNAIEYGWSRNVSCIFRDNAYHALVTDAQSPTYCLARTAFRDFVFQVKMTIPGGEDSAYGGLIFRVDLARDQYYILRINNRGTYELLASTPGSGWIEKATQSARTFHPNQANTIAIEANGTSIALSINQPLNVAPTFILNDKGGYTIGQLGLLAATSGRPADIAYNDVFVWSI